MKITKGSIVNGAYQLMRISGITRQATPEDTEIGLQVMDDYAEELKAKGLDVGWQYPVEYGTSDPADNSGITTQMAGPLKKLLVIELAGFFGKQIMPSVAITASKGLEALEQILVSIPEAQNPPTLPVGSGNEYGYRDRTFFPEPAVNNDADYVLKGDILNYSHDFSQWLVDETLVSAVWTSEDGFILITSESITDTVASAELTFDQLGGSSICIKATKTGSTDATTVIKNFVIGEC